MEDSTDFDKAISTARAMLMDGRNHAPGYMEIFSKLLVGIDLLKAQVDRLSDFAEKNSHKQN